MSEEKKQNELQFFLHDLINHTHGILLFLEQKSIKGEGLSLSEMSLLRSEIERFQQLIKNHYQFNHRHITPSSDQLCGQSFKEGLKLLLDTYLSGEKWDVHVHIDPEISEALDQAHSVSHSAVQRILGNLIKNIAENSSGEVHLSVELVQNKLLVKSRNKIVDQRGRPEGSLGLKSISHLSELLSGEYQFQQIDGQWINKLTIPLQISSSEVLKKAA